MNTYLWIAVGLSMGLLAFIRTSGLVGLIQLIGVVALPAAILLSEKWAWYDFAAAYGGLYVGIKLVDWFGKTSEDSSIKKPRR